MIPIDVIGMGLSPDDITSKQHGIIQSAGLLVGGRRQLDIFPKIDIETLVIDREIPALIETIKKRMEWDRVVVLASGDPLFYGIGATLIREIGKENVVIHPNISSVSSAFAAIKEPWHDAAFVSLHGRGAGDLSLILEKADKIAILTDGNNSPSWVAGQLLKMNNKEFSMCVLEQLGSKDQQISWHDDLLIAATMEFAMPNIVILKRKTDNANRENRKCFQPDVPEQASLRDKIAPVAGKALIYPGMPDASYIHENELITKSEIRSIVLSKLQLVSDSHIFWDLGAGSGSVSIEVSRFIPKGSVFSVEKNKKRIAQIEENCIRFNVPNIQAIHAELPGGLDALPDPDRIFIGGGGRNLDSILSTSIERLAVEGVMVVNTVLLQTMESARTLLEARGFKVDLVQIQVSRLTAMPFGDRLEALNPVWIISVKKKEQ